MKKNQVDYNEMLTYVRENLLKNQGEYSINKNQTFRKRSNHCHRVMCWCKVLLENENIDCVDEKVLLIAAIFHDVGYNGSNQPHEELGEDIFCSYAKMKKWDEELIRKVSFLIKNHSQKTNPINNTFSIELQLLMEADLLDEEGSMGIVADCIAVGMKHGLCDGYEEALCQIKKYAAEILQLEPMVTVFAAKCWREKQELVKTFIENYEKDCMLGEL